MPQSKKNPQNKCRGKYSSMTKPQLYEKLESIRGKAELQRVVKEQVKRGELQPGKEPRKVDLCEAIRRRERTIKRRKVVAGSVVGVVGAGLLAGSGYDKGKKKLKKNSAKKEQTEEVQRLVDLKNVLLTNQFIIIHRSAFITSDTAPPNVQKEKLIQDFNNLIITLNDININDKEHILPNLYDELDEVKEQYNNNPFVREIIYDIGSIYSEAQAGGTIGEYKELPALK